jgi:hypothetical protein
MVNGEPIPQFDRHRQYYASIDIDVTKIKTSWPLLNGFFKVFGFLKVPAPTVEFNQGGKTHFTFYIFKL